MRAMTRGAALLALAVACAVAGCESNARKASTAAGSGATVTPTTTPFSAVRALDVAAKIKASGIWCGFVFACIFGEMWCH